MPSAARSAKKCLEAAALRGQRALLLGEPLDLLAQALHTQANRRLTFSYRRHQLGEPDAAFSYLAGNFFDLENLQVH